MSDLAETLSGTIGCTEYSDWLLVDQAMIDRFADATLDRQYIHIDPVRAAETPFGGTIAHGFLTLSLLPRLLETMGLTDPPGVSMSVNYGLDRVRFIHPVRSGSHIRAAVTVTAVEEKGAGQIQQILDVVVEIQGADKPALAATWLTRFII